MLRGIPECISPELLKILDEMGHSDRIVLADSNFPGASVAGRKGALFTRLEGVKMEDLLGAILQLFPLDHSTDHNCFLIAKDKCDEDIPTPCRDSLERTACENGGRPAYLTRSEFYEAAADSYAIVQSGETSLYSCMILQKGVIRKA